MCCYSSRVTTWGLRSSRTAVVVVGVAGFVLFCLAPVAAVVISALAASPAAGTQGMAIWLDARQRTLLSTTATLGIGTALCATTIGAPLGFVLARVPLPRKHAARIALAAPALFPPYVVALAWTYLAGGLLGDAAYSVGAAVAVLTVVL